MAQSKRKKKKSVNLSVGRGEKLSTKKGAGLTAKGRAKYNRATGSKLKPPAPNPKTKKDAIEKNCQSMLDRAKQMGVQLRPAP